MSPRMYGWRSFQSSEQQTRSFDKNDRKWTERYYRKRNKYFKNVTLPFSQATSNSNFVYGVFRPLEFETTNKIFMSPFVQKLNYCLNNIIGVVIWADHKFSTKPSKKTLSVDSNSTGLKTPWTKFELPAPLNNSNVTL